MNLKKYLIVFLLYLTFDFGASSTAFSEAVLVEGNAEYLPAVVHSKLLENHPVILFTKDLSLNADDSPGMDEFISSQINALILKGSSPRDIAVELISCQKIEIPDFREKFESGISVSHTGQYEIYLATDKLRFSDKESLIFSIAGIRPIEISGNEILAASEFCFKIGEVRLVRNKHHKVKITLSGLEKLAESNHGFTFFLVEKEKRIKFEHLFSKKIYGPSTKLCYLFTNKNGKIEIPISWEGLKQNGTVALDIKIRLTKNMPESEEKNIDPAMKEEIAQAPLFRIDGETFFLQDFGSLEQNMASYKKEILLEKTIRLISSSAQHEYEIPQHPLYEVKWVLLEPKTIQLEKSNSSLPDPQIAFKRINPAKCLIQVKGARAPFWLIFSEAYHDQWMLFSPAKKDIGDFLDFSSTLIAQYPDFGVTENAHDFRFISDDIIYRFLSPLPARHMMVNGFANGWYLDPQKLGLAADFDLVLFFRPQAYAYLGWMITAATISLSAILLLWKLCRKSR